MAQPASAIDNNLQLYEFLTEHILDESLDPQQVAVLLSSAKNRIERLYKPEILIDEDSSKTRSSGDTYLSMKALPDNFRDMLELYVGEILYRPVPFRRRMTYKDAALRYYIDHKDNQFAICGVGGAAETIRQVYLIKTDDFTEATVSDENESTLTWPKEFWELCAWEAAEIVSSGTDIGADDLSFRMSTGQKNRKDELLHAFLMWDHDLKLKAQDNRAGYADGGEFGDGQDLINDILPRM